MHNLINDLPITNTKWILHVYIKHIGNAVSEMYMHTQSAPKPCNARLQVASPVNYYVYDTSAAAECSVAQLQRLTDCGSNIVLQQQFANEYR